MEDLDGNLHSVSLEAGDMLFYESAKSMHGRSAEIACSVNHAVGFDYVLLLIEWELLRASTTPECLCTIRYFSSKLTPPIEALNVSPTACEFVCLEF